MLRYPLSRLFSTSITLTSLSTRIDPSAQRATPGSVPAPLRLVARSAATLVLLGASMTGVAHAAVLASWNFTNTFSVTAPADTVAAPLSSATLTGATSVDNFSGNRVYVTRQLGSVNNPTIQANATAPLQLASLRFSASHNHNSGFPTNPDYQVQPQINTGAGFVNVGSPLTMNLANNGATHVVDLTATSVPAGAFSVRLLGTGFHGSTNSGTEYFAIDDVVLSSVDAAHVPLWDAPGLALMTAGLGLLGAWQSRRSRQSKRRNSQAPSGTC